ncbi:MAG: WD40/YVTN/BNR-like repeat-containing protein, partial [Terriglobia bacterium]
MKLFSRAIRHYFPSGLIVLFALMVAGVSLAAAPQFPKSMVQEMRWREIGPLRGGRTRAVCGVPSQPNVFYIGAVNGGVWKTNDYGRTWQPIFDHEPTGSIGAIAVAPSDPSMVYVASGEGLHRPDLSTGDGIYKSTDAGKTWTHLGLRDGQQIPRLVVDPHDPNRLFVAVLGHPYGPNPERGIYRSTDGGQTFQKVLYKDENTGGSDVEMDPSNPNIVYASLWEAREGPWENAAWSGTGGGLFKSTDGGDHWRQLTNGLPKNLVQINVAVASSEPSRIYATLATNEPGGYLSGKGLGIYRSDDGGEHWHRATTDPRPAERIGGGDLAVPQVDPKNPDVVYVTSIVTWRSTDGGKTWTGIRGAPGGDDYQNIWINPRHPNIILLGSDQGAIITVNGGQSWSSWYNQPTAQMYHAAADNAFPYRVCSGQQESGSACVSSRGNWGEITERDWWTVGAEEYGYVAPDPLNPDMVYGGKLTRFNRQTGQVAEVSPEPLRSPGFRAVRTAPVIFSPVDPHVLYFAGNTLWETRDGGQNWKQISPDLTRKTWEVPASVGKYRDQPSAKSSQRGVIYAVAPSPLDLNLIWAGTDDGLIQLTTDGGQHWENVTPPELKPWWKVSIMDAGHFDKQTAYAAINTFRLDDLRPRIYRTHDGGKTWKDITDGIPDGADVNVVREDPHRQGLLFAGTERAVYVSFDDGGHWQSLRLNMPATSVRDLTIKDDDLIAATHGRGFWILDDITPLRQLSGTVADANAYLFNPEPATRVRWDVNTDTPLPPDVPAGQNPPDGAIIDYYLKSAPSGSATLEILDSTGKLVRRYSSTDPVPQISPMLQIPIYWVRPPQGLSAQPGMHRFLWDMHYPPVPGSHVEYPMQAVYHNTGPAPTSPWVMPGNYTVKLMVGGESYTQPLTVKMDPRVKTPLSGLMEQFRLSKQVYDGLVEGAMGVEQIRNLHVQLQKLEKGAGRGSVAESLAALDQKAEAIAGRELGGVGFFMRRGPDTLNSVGGSLRQLLGILQGADVAPTTQMTAAIATRLAALNGLMARWAALKSQDLAALNE